MRSMKKILCVCFCLLLACLTVVPAFADCGHGQYEVTVVTATCTTDGYAFHYCPVCDDTYTDEYVRAPGHQYGEWTVAQRASCTQEGVWERTCRYCGAVETRTVPLLDHADYNADGKCDACGADVPMEFRESPFDWFVALFRKIAAWLQSLFGGLSL